MVGSTPFYDPNEYHIFHKIIECDYQVPSAMDNDAKDLISKLLVRHCQSVKSGFSFMSEVTYVFLEIQGFDRAIIDKHVSSGCVKYTVQLCALYIKYTVMSLQVVDSNKRLGSKNLGGFHALKGHPFFANINWKNLPNEMPPAMKSCVSQTLQSNEEVRIKLQSNYFALTRSRSLV